MTDSVFCQSFASRNWARRSKKPASIAVRLYGAIRHVKRH
jgi:hypothetical protein